MKNKFKKVLLAAVLTAGACLGSASANQAKAGGYVCEGTTLYQSVGFWIFQFKVGAGLENATACQGY